MEQTPLTVDKKFFEEISKNPLTNRTKCDIIIIPTREPNSTNGESRKHYD
jgi:hypothetical protein